MEKVLKSVNALKSIYGDLIAEDKPSKDATTSPKDRQAYCNVIVESMTSQSLKNSNDFQALLAVSIEILLQACGDDNADVRLNSEECLNKLIKGLYDSQIGRVLLELCKEIKKNGHPRSLKAAMSKFADLCFMIRPAKGRTYIIYLLPCLGRISQREEESIHDCLTPIVSKIFGSLGTFATESEVQGLIASFLKNLSHDSVTVRRTAGLCLQSIAANSRKVSLVLFPLINSILDILEQRFRNRTTILGCLQSLRVVISLLSQAAPRERKPVIAKICEAAFYYACHEDHTIVTSALELLEQMLLLFQLELHGVLVKEAMGTPTFVVGGSAIAHVKDKDQANVNDQSKVATPIPKEVPPADTSNPNAPVAYPEEDPSNEHQAPQDSASENVEDGEIKPLHSEDEPILHRKNSASNPMGRQFCLLASEDMFTLQGESPADIDNFPVTTLARLLCQRFLLSNHKGELLADAKVRVSSKTLALRCFNELAKMFPPLYCLPLFDHADCEAILFDASLYRNHSDPQLRGAALCAIAVFINSVMLDRRADVEDWYASIKASYPGTRTIDCPTISSLVCMLRHGFSDESSTCLRQACSAATACLHSLLHSKHYRHGMDLLDSIIALQDSSYWLLRTDILEVLASVNYRQVSFLNSIVPRSDGEATMKECFQKKALKMVFACLSEHDGRIRKAAAETVVGMVNNFDLKNMLNRDVVALEAFELCRHQLGDVLCGKTDDVTKSSKRVDDITADKSLLKTYRGYEGESPVESISESLSFILEELATFLSRSTSKHRTRGALFALRLLSTTYSPCTYPHSWGCHFTEGSSASLNLRSRTESTLSSASVSSNNGSSQGSQETIQQVGMIPLVMGLLKSSWLPLDIPSHCDAIVLAGNLLAGAVSHGFKVSERDVSDQSEKMKAAQPVNGSQSAWTGIHDHMIGAYSYELFTHLTKLMSICHHVISETSPNSFNKSVLPGLASNPSIPSPIKRKERLKEAGGGPSKSSPTMPRKLLAAASPLPKTAANKEDSDKEKQVKKALGSFQQSRILMKLHDQLTGAYKNYKGSMEFGPADRLCRFVRTVLEVVCQSLEAASFQDIGVYTEEIIGYLKTSFVIEPTVTVQCVQQLLKALFGTNLLCKLDRDEGEAPKSPSRSHPVSGQELKPTFSHQIFHHPLNHLTMSLANSSFHYSHPAGTSKEGSGWFGSIKKKVEEKLQQNPKSSKGNKSSIQNYIRLFESLVIKSLKLYTMTASVHLQTGVLNLLAQLVQLRVNYCMLDADQVFITFVIKQFESIESGLIRESDVLVPHVFFFLVLLSYEAYHSKPVISMPKIIQLCDGLLASGRKVTTHVILAMQPIVHDLFVVRALEKNGQESVAQREVVLAMLAKLMVYPQVFTMVTTALRHYRRDNSDRWKLASRQVADVLLPLLDKLQIKLTNHSDMHALHSLLEGLAPASLRPVDLIVQVMMSPPTLVESISVLHRWMAKVTALLRVLVCNVTEDDVIDSIARSSNNTSINHLLPKAPPIVSTNSKPAVSRSDDPAMTLAMFFHDLVGVMGAHLSASLTSSVALCDATERLLLCQQLEELLLLMTYMHRSGSFKRFTAATRLLLGDASHVITTSHVLGDFLAIGREFPILTLIWAQLLSHVGYIDFELWSKLTRVPDPCCGHNATSDLITTFHDRIIKLGSTILLCDYVTPLGGRKEPLTRLPSLCWAMKTFPTMARQASFPLHGSASSRDAICSSLIDCIWNVLNDPNLQSQNQHHCDTMSWLIEHHARDVVELCGEPPVQDFLGIVEQTTSSEQFLKSIASYCVKGCGVKASHMRKIAKCLNGFTDSCVGLLLQVILSSEFMFSPVMAVSRSYDQLACNHVESLLTLQRCEVTKQLSVEDVDNLLASFSTPHQMRFARLHTLLVRLKGHMTNEGVAIATPTTNPPITFKAIVEPPDKNWLKSILVSCCRSNDWSPECAKVLSCLEYDDVMNVMHDEAFLPRYLDPCIAFGMSEVVAFRHEVAPYSDDLLSSIMKASRDRLLAYVTTMVDQVPDVDLCMDPSGEYSSELNSMLLGNGVDDIIDLCGCLVRFLAGHPSLHPPYKLNQPHHRGCVKLAVLACKVVLGKLRHGSVPPTSVATTCLELMQQTLLNDEMCNIFNEPGNTGCVIIVTEAIYAIVRSHIGELPYIPPYHPSTVTLLPNSPSQTCVHMSQLFDVVCLTRGLDHLAMPASLLAPIYNVVLHLARSDLFNSYIRIPRLLWRYGWEVTPGGTRGVHYPDIPLDYLQEKEALSEYISIINRIGWTSRQQFEETWAGLLGVLVSQPIVDNTNNEQNDEAVEVSCLAIRGLTSLVVNCALQPHAGNTATSKHQTHHRQPMFKLHHCKAGRQLERVREIISQELNAVIVTSSHFVTHHCYQLPSVRDNVRVIEELAFNTESIMTSPWRYGLGRFSIRSFRDLHGIFPLTEDPEVLSDDLSSPGPSFGTESLSHDDSDGSDMFEAAAKSSPVTPSGNRRPLSPYRVRDGVDVHSCVQFLVDLYSEWFREAAQSAGGVARPLLCECTRSLLLISDLFSERQQFEWMFSSLANLHGVQPSEDDVMLQYIVGSLCKAGAVLGMGRSVCEGLYPVIEAALNSSLPSCRISALYGMLWCLEEYPTKHMRPLVDLIMEFVPGRLVDVSTCPSLHDEEYVIALMSVAYYVIVKCQDIVMPEFISIVMQASILMTSPSDSTTPSRVFHTVVHGLEGLVLTFSISSQHCESLLKAAADQLQSSPNIARTIAACGLMTTCMYSGRLRTSNPNDSSESQSTPDDDVIETRLLAMERISLLFDRIRRGSGRDARVMIRILPLILDDFFSSQDIMNKIIAEFVSTLQPFPDLVAVVLHKVFQTLHSRDESKLVQEWVMLSLNNAKQRSPLSTAVWCLTCLFVCASTNHWINSLLPIITSRMKRPDPDKDWSLFCKAAADFYTYQLTEDLDRRTFHALFASPPQEGAYKMLIDSLQTTNDKTGSSA